MYTGFSLLAVLVVVLVSGAVAQPQQEVRRSAHKFQKAHMKKDHGVDDATDQSFFKLHDVDGSGSLDLNELKNLYSSHSKVEVPYIDDVVASVYVAMDTDKNGQISLEEYETAVAAEKKEKNGNNKYFSGDGNQEEALDDLNKAAEQVSNEEKEKVAERLPGRFRDRFHPGRGPRRPRSESGKPEKKGFTQTGESSGDQKGNGQQPPRRVPNKFQKPTTNKQ